MTITEWTAGPVGMETYVFDSLASVKKKLDDVWGD
jgi:hypothetical protein